MSKGEKKITLIKYFSRQGYPLFFCYIWSHSELKGLFEWLGEGLKNVVMFREKETDKIIVWYDLDEIDRFRTVIATKVDSDDKWFGEVQDAFKKYWKELQLYSQEKKTIENVDDLKEYYEIWLKWWTPMAILFEIPNIKSLPKSIRDIALKGRVETQEFSDSGDEAIETFFKKYYPKFLSLWRLMTPKEMFRVDKLSDEEIDVIQQRGDGWALVNGELSMLEALDDKLNELGVRLETYSVQEEVREIKGQSACVGNVKGKVKLVLESHNINELKEGEILVTEMTTPEFVPAMKKAAAFVTDEGGVTCHAAIMAREMNKPCIIGTKIATQVLKDGDEVEVEADNGVVKLLRRVG